MALPQNLLTSVLAPYWYRYTKKPITPFKIFFKIKTHDISQL